MKKLIVFIIIINIICNINIVSAQRYNVDEYDKMAMSYPKSQGLIYNYPSLEEVYAFLDSIVSVYPEITYLDTSWTSQNMEFKIPVLKISDNPEVEEDEPAIGYDGLIHSREPVSMLICMEIIEYLVSNYNINEDVKRWVDNSEIFIIPILNPDGWKYIHDSSLFYMPSWRKNMRDNDGNGNFNPLYDGVDLNRNFDFLWAYGNSNPGSIAYRGPFPFSEKETQLKKKIASEQKFVLSINYHSPPIGYLWAETVGIDSKFLDVINPDYELLKIIADSIATRIPKFNSIPQTHYDTASWPCDKGYSDCWMNAVNGTLEFAIEVGPEHFPPDSAPLQIAKDNIDGGLYLLNRVFGPGITGHVKDENTLQPVPAEIRVVDIDTAQLYVEPRTNDSIFGRFFRLLNPGIYAIEAIANGYDTLRLENIVIDDTLVYLDFNLNPVSVDEFGLNAQLTLYPNPAHQDINISVEGFEIDEVSIYTLTGQQMIQARPVNGTIDISGLQPGMYIVEVTIENTRLRQKLLVQ